MGIQSVSPVQRSLIIRTESKKVGSSAQTGQSLDDLDSLKEVLESLVHSKMKHDTK